MNSRVGIGYDVHQLVKESPLIIGGVKIPFEKGILGHSDGDVLTHAVCDALLGAANLGDIGKYFPSENADIEGISSLVILKNVATMIREQNFHVGNLDASIILQAPKLSTYIADMKRNLVDTCAITEKQISIKATTTDHLGFTGRGEGVAAMAVALLYTL
jgi:2-C-methyl-D-erythritol 2,4-cyclodiphosphate synthase